MPINYEFQGWLGYSPDAINGKMEWGSFEPKQWEADDVDIKITHCSICGADCHMLRSGWGEIPYPCCVGHEIVGKVVRTGHRVKHLNVGDRVGVGAQARSCLGDGCIECSVGRPHYCPKNINTYGGIYPNDIGKSYGGFGDYVRIDSRFAVKIPEKLPSEYAAPLMCAGITVYSPLRKNNCGPGKIVGVIGVGGLGHFAVLFAKALKADKVIGISRKQSKRKDVLALGADDYIATDDGEQNWATKHAKSMDLIICTVSSANMPLNDYLKLLRYGGDFVQVGAPDDGDLPAVNAFTLINGGFKLSGSAIGSPKEIQEMLYLAVELDIKPWVELRPLTDANQAILDMEEGKARYRYVLVNEKHLDA
ncbi:uncharacterized protein NECHADRAFT_98203 [Fusarium vanettenii 77-13-4]|uniref:alcohol dehydrogenase (NADP(+)) n=1 Tax=Fusarium vanettenii (strain ATCC MYA-4622 / CBS 123669 / FGSC 9596 / NRRL 45880 / 77-13-4) TaxID=660122 RepID=C7ZKC2_FUSV7|nr:uncharacterized protein NECHADRAFT_98203 [Fusarium vanettenii 77-13-4]EEU35501.1 hypothetical protein NECHADRAFT_98203 [Fusarium vanettenii 77-13-4]